MRENSPKDGFPDWGAALAREVLLLSSAHPDLADSIRQSLGPFVGVLVPFTGGPPLEAFFDGPPAAAAALIPLQSKNGSSAVFGQIWVVPSEAAATLAESTRRRLVESLPPSGKAGNPGVIMVTTASVPERIEGRSWELAARLASEACVECLNGNGKPALNLASRWMVSGSIEPTTQDVLEVGLRGKLSLAIHSPSRNWLLPAANQATVPPEFESETAGRLHYAIDVPSAWSQITGQGFAAGSDKFWENEPFFGVGEFHCLVSNAQGPMLAGFLWSQPKKIVLWTSTFMADKASQLKIACDRLRDSRLTSLAGEDAVVIRPLDDTNLSDIRAAFLAHPVLGRGSATPVAFNITGGNLLMRLAIMDLARLRPHIHLVYRPEGRDDLEFVEISHPFLQPVTAKVRHRTMDAASQSAWAEKILNFRLPGNNSGIWADLLLDAINNLEEKPFDALKSSRHLQPA